MQLVWTMAIAVVAITACNQNINRRSDTCADYPNGVCPVAAADQTAAEEQAGSAEQQGGSAMRKRLADSVDFSVLDKTNSTLLHWAAVRKKNTETMKFLLAQGVIDINKQNDYGNTALHVAARHGDYGGVELLLKQPGIDKNLRNNSIDCTGGCTAHNIAVGWKRTLIAALLAP